MVKAAFSTKKTFNEQIGLKFKKETSEVLHFVWRWDLKNWDSRSEISRRFWNVLLEKDGEDRLGRSLEKLLHWVKEKKNSQHIIKRRKSIWIGHISLRNCLLKHFITEIIEGSIEVAESWERKLSSHWITLRKEGNDGKFKEEALDRTLWKIRSGRNCESIVRQTTEWMTTVSSNGIN